MYITSIPLNKAAEAFRNPLKTSDTVELHSRVCRLYPPIAEQVDLKVHSKYGVLWTVNYHPNPGDYDHLYLQSTIPPTLYHYPELDMTIKELPSNYPNVNHNDILNFSIVVNPTYRPKNPSGKARILNHTNTDDIQEWFTRRLTTDSAGNKSEPWAQVLTIDTITPAYRRYGTDFIHSGTNGSDRTITHSLARITGLIQVKSPTRFKHIVNQGFPTRAKSYGAGLLQISKPTMTFNN